MVTMLVVMIVLEIDYISIKTKEIRSLGREGEECRKWVVVKEGYLGHEYKAMYLNSTSKCVVEEILVEISGKCKSPINRNV